MKRFALVATSLLLSLATPSVFAGANVTFEKATFSGIIGADNPADQGSFSIKTTSTGKYTVKVKIGPKTVTHKGQFSPTGGVDETFTFKPLPFVSLDIHLVMQLGPNSDYITGYVQVDDNPQINFKVYQIFNYTSKNPAPQAGHFTGLFTKADGTSPTGNGTATVSVSKTGSVKVVGTLPDGSKISTGGKLSTTGVFPIFNVLYSRKGALAGFAQFHDENTADTIVPDQNGTELLWTKLTDDGSALQFSGEERLVIHRYTRPAKGARVLASLDASNGVATFTLTGGGLSQTFSEGITVSTQNTVTITDGTSQESLTLSINAKTGLITGSLNLAIDGSTAERPVSLIVDQSTNSISGFFIGTTGAGDATITPAP